MIDSTATNEPIVAAKAAAECCDLVVVGGPTASGKSTFIDQADFAVTDLATAGIEDWAVVKAHTINLEAPVLPPKAIVHYDILTQNNRLKRTHGLYGHERLRAFLAGRDAFRVITLVTLPAALRRRMLARFEQMRKANPASRNELSLKRHKIRLGQYRDPIFVEQLYADWFDELARCSVKRHDLVATGYRDRKSEPQVECARLTGPVSRKSVAPLQYGKLCRLTRAAAFEPTLQPF
jgi:hypothetical protein